MAIILRSEAFEDGGSIPSRYTCDGAGISPPLSWSGVPHEARNLALICEDPDAPKGVFTHWVVFNIPPDTTQLPEDIPPAKTLKSGARQGTNSVQRIGYVRLCPPSGAHRYYFRLYALDTELNLQPGITKEELLEAMQGHVVAEAQVMGTYARE
ncbi:MAG TPA: YbhB/YbcL family Raf kinase inhibitor-like protein [Armatimonadota bacterium]|nr:YbhB/YbcL family Raf kinase inhibitor-like protein [Armatimonadota bacterium]